MQTKRVLALLYRYNICFERSFKYVSVSGKKTKLLKTFNSFPFLVPEETSHVRFFSVKLPLKGFLNVTFSYFRYRIV